jgi:hypothetical protein
MTPHSLAANALTTEFWTKPNQGIWGANGTAKLGQLDLSLN